MTPIPQTLLIKLAVYSSVNKAANCELQTAYLISGGRRIRTFVAEATDLQSVPFDRSGTSPSFNFGNNDTQLEAK